MTATTSFLGERREIQLWSIVLLAFAVHGPLLLMQLPANSYDTNFHIFFASHYAQSWFNPWNEKWFAGFSQTTYPPLPQQWMALLSHFVGLPMSYMLVQLVAVLLLPVGVYRYARIWVGERGASYAALASVFLGSLSMLVYQAGQLSTTTAAPLYLLAIPYIYEWLRAGESKSLVKGLALAFAAAAAHHVTLIFGSFLFLLPVLWLAIIDREKDASGETRSVAGVLTRAGIFAALMGFGAAIVLGPYWLALIQNPIKQMPIPHASRTNLLLNPNWGMNYFVIPYGALILALPFVILRASRERRLRPLLFGFWLTFLFGLGGTTPVPRILLGRAYEVLTFERFTFWATIMALPVLGMLAAELIDRFKAKAAVPLWIAAVATCAFAVAWVIYRPINQDPALDLTQVTNFLNRDGHDKYRFLTLGFGNQLAKISTNTAAGTVDGDYNSARTLPEMTRYGAAQITNSKYYGIAGMESLRAMLKHAQQYGLKYVFIRDRYYEPMVTFAGWRKIDTYDNGLITVWEKDDVPPATKIESNAIPPAWQGIAWGIFPIGSSIVALFLMVLIPDKKRVGRTIEFPAPEPVFDTATVQGARR
ncbi:MAG: integral rane protein [Acidobacteriaceae bacterium]|nr:integral rane protein [Acidobacteriaceae bacterium]